MTFLQCTWCHINYRSSKIIRDAYKRNMKDMCIAKKIKWKLILVYIKQINIYYLATQKYSLSRYKNHRIDKIRGTFDFNNKNTKKWNL